MICVICSKKTKKTTTGYRKTCSPQCLDILRTRNAKKNPWNGIHHE